MNPSLVVAGHSHAAALGPPTADRDEGAVPELVPIDGAAAVALIGPATRDTAYWDALAEAAATRVPAILWGEDRHVRALLIERGRPLDFVLSAAPDLPMDPRASYVAEAQLRALIAPAIAPLGPLLRRLSAPIMLVGGTPPPLQDEASIRARIATDPDFAAIAEARGIAAKDLPLTSPYTMQKIWSLTQGMLAETAAAAGAIFVPVPDRVRDDQGFLLDRFADTVVHANRDYGREMLAELIAAAEAALLTGTDRS